MLILFSVIQVYEYNPHEKTNSGCCESIVLFTDMFPLHPDSANTIEFMGETVHPLTGNVDAVYFSYGDRTVYFFRGKYVWENTLFHVMDPETGIVKYNSIDQNELRFRGKSNEFWQDLCHVDLDQHSCTSLHEHFKEHMEVGT